MRTTVTRALTGALALFALARPVTAQVPDTAAVVDSLAADSTDVRAPLPQEVVGYLESMTSVFPGAPFGMGLIPTGMVEARIAEAYVLIAGSDSANLDNMTDNMVHVLHAIDPGLVPDGLGLGYGVKQAAEGVRTYIGLALAVDGVSETVRYHAPFIEDAATGALARADEAIDLTRRIEASTDPEATLPLLERLARIVRSMAYGFDRDRDGRIGNDASEAGLAQAAYHLELIRRVEGLAPPPPLPPDLPIPERPERTGVEGRAGR
jgi:hypothetical protein